MHDRAVLEKGGHARTARWFLERIVGIDGHESELLKGEGSGVGLRLLLVITGYGRLVGLPVDNDLKWSNSDRSCDEQEELSENIV